MTAMKIIAGMTIWSAPKITSATTAHTMPVAPAKRFSRFFHCSMNSTTKRAVRAKSSPVVLKVMRPPSRRNTSSGVQKGVKAVYVDGQSIGGNVLPIAPAGAKISVKVIMG